MALYSSGLDAIVLVWSLHIRKDINSNTICYKTYIMSSSLSESLPSVREDILSCVC